MESKIMNVYYDTDNLPFKDINRSVHFPIVGSAFNGANNTTQIRFFVDRIGGVDNVSWVVIAKLPNGKIQYQLLDSENYETEDNENYLSFDLSSYYTQYKGDIYISLNGYQGQVNVVEDEDTGIYTIVGTPTIQATGSIKLAINYAPQLPQGNTFGFSDYQLIAGALSNKTNIGNSIFVLDNIEIADLSGYKVGQYFYDRKTQQYYEKTDSGYELADDKSGMLGKKYIDDKYDFILSAFAYIVENFVNDNVLYVKGEIDDTTLTMEVGTVSGQTYYLETSYIFYSKEESDDKFVPYSGATKNVDIGTHYLTSGGLITNGNISANTLNLYQREIGTDRAITFVGYSGGAPSSITFKGDYSIELKSNISSYKIYKNNQYVEIATEEWVNTNYVNKTSSGYKIYATDEQGNQTTLPYDEDTEGKVVRRDESGHVYVQNPNANGQATPKQYVDVFAKSLTASINTSTYVMTLTLKDNLGNTLSTQTIDLPLETMVVGGSYDDENEEIVLELKNGQTISIPVGDLVSGLVSTSDLASELTNYYTKTQIDTTLVGYVPNTRTIAGNQLNANVSAQTLTDSLVFMNNTTDLDYVMGD